MEALLAVDFSTLTFDQLGDINEESFSLFENEGNPEYLRLAVSLGRILVERSAQGLEKVQWMNVVSQQYDRLYAVDGVSTDLAAAVQYAGDAITESSRCDGLDVLELQVNLERLLWKQYCAEKTPAKLREVISVSQDAIRLREIQLEAQDIDLAVDLHNLGIRSYTLYRHTGARQSLEAAVAAHRRALSCSDVDQYPEVLLSCNIELGKTLQALYENTNSLYLIVEAVQLANGLVNSTDRSAAEYHNRLHTLSVRLRVCATHTGCLYDHHKAIAIAREAILYTPAGHLGLPMKLNDLCLALVSRYEKLGADSDLKAALEAIDEAIKLLSDASSDRATIMSTAADAYSYKFIRTGHLADIRAAVTYRDKSIACTSIGNPVLVGRMSNLSNDLMLLYTRSGLLSDVHRAVKAGSEGLNLASQIGSIQRFTIHSVLSNALITRFERLGSFWDLENGLENAKKAIEQLPLPRLQARLVSNLAMTLHLRYRRTGNLADLTASIDAMSSILNSKTASLEEQHAIMANLASSLRLRALATTDASANYDLLRAKLLSSYNVHYTHKDHRDYAIRRSTLSNILCLLYQRSNRPIATQYLQNAIHHAEKAVSCSSDGPEKASILVGLGNLYEIQSKRLPEQDYIHKCLEQYLNAWRSRGSSPLKRINAATFAANIMIDRGDHNTASRLIEEALALFPLAGARSLAREDQQHVLSQFSGLASLGCSTALQAGRSPQEAMQILEMGRGIILGNINNDPAPKPGDNGDANTLYPRYSALLNDLNRQAVENEYPARLSSQFRVSATVDELHSVIEAIRKIPGHEDFQMPYKVLEVQAAAAEGTIVAICSTRLRTDAIIVEQHNFSVLPFPEVDFEDVIRRAKLILDDLTSYTLRTLGPKSKQFEDQMCWLWNSLVHPIIRTLKLEATKAVLKLARIRWIAVGPLAVFPFHAAGIHRAGSVDNTLAYAISSYAPTVKSLLRASRDRSPIFKLDRNKLLLVGMPETARMRDLKEVNSLQEALQNLGYDVNPLEHNAPSKVLSLLSQHNMLLCACHGIVNSSNPMESYLALQGRGSTTESASHDDKSDPFDAILNDIDVDGRLTVRAISYHTRGDSSKPMPRLAFLMACSTATVKDLGLSDEVLHLASTFHLAGCQHVIGTMWQAIQTASVEVARLFYADIQGREKAQRVGMSDAWHIAAALHKATLSVREQNPSLILKWAPFMHIGP